jgi:hypothetical protein
MGTALATLVQEVLTPQDARRIVFARDSAVACARAMEGAFKWAEPKMPRPLDNTATEAELEQYKLDCHLARASAVSENVARLRGAFWAVVALHVTLMRNPGDREASDMLRLLQGYLHDEWPAPSVAAKLLEYFAVPIATWQAWASEAEVPGERTMRNALAHVHVIAALRAPTSVHSRGRQSDLFDPPRAGRVA